MSLLRLYIRILSELRDERDLVLLLALANVLLAVAQFAEPVLFGRIVDVLTKAQSAQAPPTFATLAPLVGAWVGFGLFTIAAGALVALHADRLSHRRRLAMVATYFNHVLSLPLAFHGSTHSGRVLKVMIEGSNGMASLWLSFFREHCASFVTLGVLLPASLIINWQLGLLLLVLVCVFAALTFVVLRKTESLQGSVERYHTDLAERASDALGNVPVIQSFTRVEAEVSAMRATIDRLLAAQRPVLSWWALASIASRASATLTVLAVFLMGTWLNLNGQATVGQVVTFMNLATLLIARLEQTVGFVNFIFMQGAKIGEFFEVLDTTATVADRPGARALGKVAGEVAFDDVSFSYDGRKPAVLDVSFTARPGETIALVGSTGSGKSTTLALLHRTFDPQSGRILIDGTDLRDVTLTSLRRAIGVVFQEPMLFARSIRENMQAGKPDATDAEIYAALERAQASDFIARQPEGLDTVVGERGRSLSGGERQRLSIARALLKDPPILILDEATSALDAATESKLQKALSEVMKGRTTFVIAHRLATIREAGRILVFNKGSIIEAGSFDELVAKDGVFAGLARAQFMAGAAQQEQAPEARHAAAGG
ncbi:glucan ABC transporter ATP-binding protein/ permease [Chelatococcus reniformis]|uniref:Beta-(1-->2)glucan export ATP-binding/permease protein NdvA n=1 Tax=Chelatococcus reniformis TaxID=1494448 RepID=A0A916UNK3_9HYPH|nr:glucan ABC transporter ATP-binding protein/ permease [Chelatococcus reniformis]GGC78906.1 beta-(1-->2)glucan export ATP-binding/permease protein NdvA [Chelatococcus reniformis]